MRTAVSEFDTLASDLGFSNIPRELRAHRAPTRAADAAWRSAPTRQTCSAPRQSVAHDRARVRRAHVIARRPAVRARGVHPLNRVQRAQIGFAALALSALMTALAVAGLIGLAQLRAGNFGPQPAPAVEVSIVPPAPIDGIAPSR
ncbi:hypothetical protein H0264_30250 [Nocardia huaxiensis]|uniref:Uncharacterized protein n=1 Tax=Nocardia huaxiensis TaxID=2755382 RepID=A0A7D6ZF56_9NOCA|nr:hypothetical protein [Nocardia huaxiensis]QLY29499.1 hypothetical protein H0264_30250 [Nocardia huaxiensis]